jgi:hypothetical protein
MNNLPESKLTRNQSKVYGSKAISKTETLTVFLRYDDRCKNGHNSFAITGEIRDSRYRKDNGIVACGCLHDDIQKYFPELAKYIKWHLCSSEGPMYYIANTVYHSSNRDFNSARESAIWHEATDEILSLPEQGLKAELEKRLPDLMVEFKNAMVELGFEY